MTRDQAKENGSEDRTTVPLWRIAKIIVSTVDKKSYENQVPVKLCNYVDVYYHDRIDDTIDFMESTASPSEISSFSAKPGDVVITKDSETAEDIGKSAIVDSDSESLVYGYHLTTYRPYDLRYSGFLKYLFDAAPFRARLINSCNGVTRVGLTGDTQRNIRVPVPAPSTARTIADYLDAETAQIDASIDAQRRLIALLQERRQSSIERILWQGRGRSVRIGRSADTLPGCAFPSSEFSPDGNGPFLLRGVNVKPRSIDRTDAVFCISTATEVPPRYKLEPGDYVLGMDRPFVSNGVRVARVPEDLSGSYLVQRVLRIRSSSTLLAEYLSLFLSSPEFVRYLAPDFTGISVPHLSEGQVRNFSIPERSIPDQRRVIHEANQSSSRIDTLISRCQRLIELLQERRSAVITAAVTGQIDVTRSEEAA